MLNLPGGRTGFIVSGMTRDFDIPAPIATTAEEAHDLIVILWAEVRRLTEENGALRQERDTLLQEVTAFRVRLERLEEKLRADSTNSSLPPSSDGLKGKEGNKRKRGPSGRKRGAQPGHAGRRRELVPTEQVDDVVPCRPDPACECGGQVVDVQLEERRQQFELPKIKPHVTEFQLYPFTGVGREQSRAARLTPTGDE